MPVAQRQVEISEVPLEEFSRRFKKMLLNDDCKIVWFFGAGCSVSSGIPSAAGLVQKWLQELKYLEDGSNADWEPWAERRFPNFDVGAPANIYGEVIQSLFRTGYERQQEIEELTSDKDPSIGYVVFTSLASHENYGPKTNVVLTTNFDDLVADTLRLSGRPAPLIVAHDSLARFVRRSRNRTLVVKVHGDARLAPLNTAEETRLLDIALVERIIPLFSDCALIFLGYGGNDESIRGLLDSAPKDSFPWGIYWVGSKRPVGPVGTWLDSRFSARGEVFHVKNNNFDEFFRALAQALELSMPDGKYISHLFGLFREQIESDKLKAVNKQIEKDKKGSIERHLVSGDEDSLESVNEQTKRLSDIVPVDEASLELLKRARAASVENLALAKKLFEQVSALNPSNASIQTFFANFLGDFVKDLSAADEAYKRAVALEPGMPSTLILYAMFLDDDLKDFSRAEEMYQRAFEADPSDSHIAFAFANFLAKKVKDLKRAEAVFEQAINSGSKDASLFRNFANFLADSMKDLPRAESMYEKALKVDPSDWRTLRSYAIFLSDDLEDPTRAEVMYERAVEAAPDNANIALIYAIFLGDQLNDLTRAEAMYERAIEINPRDAGALRIYAYFLSDHMKDNLKAERMYELALNVDENDLKTLQTYSVFLERELKDPTRALAMFERAVAVDPSNARFLCIFANFLATDGGALSRAESVFERALELDPDDVATLEIYAAFLATKPEELPRAQEMYEKVLAINPNDANTLGNYSQILFAGSKDYEDCEAAAEIAEGLLARSDLADELRLELCFYLVVHRPESEAQLGSTIGRLIGNGVRSVGWRFDVNLDWAKLHNDSRVPFLQRVADVICDRESSNLLEKEPIWIKWIADGKRHSK